MCFTAVGSAVLTFFIATTLIGIVMSVAVPTDYPWDGDDKVFGIPLDIAKGIGVLSSSALIAFMNFRRTLRSERKKSWERTGRSRLKLEEDRQNKSRHVGLEENDEN